MQVFSVDFLEKVNASLGLFFGNDKSLSSHGKKKCSAKEIERLIASYIRHEQWPRKSNIIEMLSERIVQRLEAT